MNNKSGLIAIAVVVVVIVGGVILMNNKDDDTSQNSATNTSVNSDTANNSSPTPTPAPATTSPDNVTNTDDSAEVEIEDFKFAPGNLTVKKGTTVKWTNKDSASHNVIGDNGAGPQSGTLAKGDSYEFKFDEVGTFTYVCTFHSGMTGTITVTE